MKYTYGKNQTVDLTDEQLYNLVMQRKQEMGEERQDTKTQTTGSTTGFFVICILVILLIAFTVWRYAMVNKSINKGQTLATVALLSPEIGQALRLLI